MSKAAKVEVHLWKTTSDKILAVGNFTLGDKLKIACKVVNSENGPFMAMPRSKGKDGKWYNDITILDKDLFGQVSVAVMNKYKEMGGKVDTSKQEKSNEEKGDDYPF